MTLRGPVVPALGLVVAALAIVASTLVPIAASQAAQRVLPLLSIADLEYEGAFRLELGNFGASGSGYGPGVIGLGADGESLFVVSNPQVSAVAEYPVAAPSLATSLADLPIAGPPIQPFVTVVDRAPSGNPQALDRIGGMGLVAGALVVNAYEYYDAPADNTHTTLALSNGDDLAGSAVTGWAALGGAAHASGWISAVPPEWQGALGGTHISGNSSGVPINGRSSMGPSAFAVDIDPSLGSVGSASPLLDFDLENPLADDLENASLTNGLWTHLSRATYGVVIGGTRTYLTIGQSGGHSSGVSYGVPPWGGNSGYYANDRNDHSAWYWLWDVDDLVAVRSGAAAPSSLRPYASGSFDASFANRDTRLGGATWDAESRRLYVALAGADTSQSEFEAPPLILAYKIDQIGNQPNPTPTPTPTPSQSEPVMHAVSCLAGRARVDTNIVNTGDLAATYRIEFEGLSPRARAVEAGDWWRMPITGRFDGDWDISVTRDGVVVSSQTVTTTCEQGQPVLFDAEVRVINACRSGLGYVLFQFVNPSGSNRSWVIEFDGVANRSTTAAPYGQAIRAVTGRPAGDYQVIIRSGGDVRFDSTVAVDCSA